MKRFRAHGYVRHITELWWLQPQRRRRRRRPRWCLAWRTPIMPTSSFMYFGTKAEALAAQARLQPAAESTVRLHRR